MASSKLILDRRHRGKDGTYPLAYRISHSGKVITIPVGHRILERHWTGSKVRNSTENYHSVEIDIDKLSIRIHHAVDQLNSTHLPYTVKDVKEKVLNKLLIVSSFNQYGQHLIDTMMNTGRVGNAKSYRCALSSLSSLYGNEIKFQSITYKLLTEYEERLKMKGVTINGIAAYMRAIRAIYNRAIKEDVVDRSLYPFDKYKIKHQTTAKRALSDHDLQKLFNHVETESEAQRLALLYFKLTFLLVGINFTDLSQLKPSNISGCRVRYRRQKTGKLYDIVLSDPAIELIELVHDPALPYLLPILDRVIDDPEERRKRIGQRLKQTNKALKRIGIKLGFPLSLTSYSGRHSVGSVIRRMGYSIEIISQCLGHQPVGLSVTNRYVEVFDQSIIDEVVVKLGDRFGQ